MTTTDTTSTDVGIEGDLPLPAIDKTGNNLDTVNNLISDYGDHDIADDVKAVDFRVVNMTGPLAEMLLYYNKRPQVGTPGTNRRLIETNTKAILTDIKAGNWRFTHQGIAFNPDGFLVDGQHRLAAIVKAWKSGEDDISLPMVIALGVQHGEKIDLTRRRGVSTFFQMEGYASAGHLATIVANIHRYSTANFDRQGLDLAHWTRPVTLEQSQRVLIDWPKAVNSVGPASLLTGLLPPSGAGAAWTICITRYPEEMNMEFIRRLKSGANLDENSPILKLRNWCLANNSKGRGGRRLPAWHAMAVYFKAFRAFREGTTVEQLSYKNTVERFPRP